MEPGSARSEWLSKSKWEEAQLISVRSLKSQVKGGREGEIMKFLIKKKKKKIKCVYIYMWLQSNSRAPVGCCIVNGRRMEPV